MALTPQMAKLQQLGMKGGGGSQGGKTKLLWQASRATTMASSGQPTAQPGAESAFSMYMCVCVCRGGEGMLWAPCRMGLIRTRTDGEKIRRLAVFLAKGVDGDPSAEELPVIPAMPQMACAHRPQFLSG